MANGIYSSIKLELPRHFRVFPASYARQLLQPWNENGYLSISLSCTGLFD